MQRLLAPWRERIDITDRHAARAPEHSFGWKMFHELVRDPTFPEEVAFECFSQAIVCDRFCLMKALCPRR
jgi:hypothetical protein